MTFYNIRPESLPPFANYAALSVYRPPFDGYCVVTTDTDSIYVWNAATSTWVIQSNITNLENKYVRTTRFTSISSGTSGTVTLPPNSTVILDDFGGTTDAVTSQISGGFPTYTSALTSLGAVVATTFNTSGNYVLSGVPSSYPIAIIFRVQQKLKDFDSTSPDIIGGPEIVGGGGVTSFNTRTGAVTLLGSDVTTALTYTPEDIANKSTVTTLGTSNTLYPSQLAVKTYVDRLATADMGINMLGGINLLTTGYKGLIRCKNAGTITAYRIDSFATSTGAPIVGTLNCNVNKNGVLMGVADISSASTTLDTILPGWTTAFVKDDLIEFNVTSNSGCRNIIITLYYNVTG